jgi:hypothetical protein
MKSNIDISNEDFVVEEGKEGEQIPACCKAIQTAYNARDRQGNGIMVLSQEESVTTIGH